jgi:hypothetical protein
VANAGTSQISELLGFAKRLDTAQPSFSRQIRDPAKRSSARGYAAIYMISAG